MNGFDSPYPGYDVLSKWNGPSFNEQTRRALRERLDAPQTFAFLSSGEARLLQAVCARLVPQPDRTRPVPIAEAIDRKLAADAGPGYRQDGTPPFREAWRQGLAGIRAEALRRTGKAFVDLPPSLQDEILGHVQKGEVETGAFGDTPPAHFFSAILLRGAVSAYYAHPEAWNEIGFGGPASPRGYVRLGPDARDPWEAKERGKNRGGYGA